MFSRFRAIFLKADSRVVELLSAGVAVCIGTSLVSWGLYPHGAHILAYRELTRHLPAEAWGVALLGAGLFQWTCALRDPEADYSRTRWARRAAGVLTLFWLVLGCYFAAGEWRVPSTGCAFMLAAFDFWVLLLLGARVQRWTQPPPSR